MVAVGVGEGAGVGIGGRSIFGIPSQAQRLKQRRTAITEERNFFIFILLFSFSDDLKNKWFHHSTDGSGILSDRAEFVYRGSSVTSRITRIQDGRENDCFSSSSSISMIA